MRRVVCICVYVAASLGASASIGCGPFLPAPPSGPGYTYGRAAVPYRSERRGEGFEGAYTRAFAYPGSVAEGRDPGPRVGGTPGGYRYNEHLGDRGEVLSPAPDVERPAEPQAVSSDAGVPAVVEPEIDGGPS